MSDFVVSARKYRPQQFETVVGQEHITKTLENAISNNHLAQAFLFCGPRGVGKTTCARILARQINIATDDRFDEETDLSYNLFELDAASNNSVDDIRMLIDQVRIPPQIGKYKAYIIDEVHMLSTSAFNAFLKTLEEPPPHAIFILATTEKHKILPTILSRCQVFDFNRITIDGIMSHLKGIAEKENIQAEDEALHVIAMKADGALRDALSIFDQMVTFSGNNLTYQDVIKNLHVLDYEYYFKIVDQFLEKDHASALITFDDILKKGFDAHNFIVGLSNHFRDLMVYRDERTQKLLEVPPSVIDKYSSQSKEVDDSFALSAMNILNQCDVQYKGSKNPRLHVELALLKISHLRDALNLAEAVKKKS